MHGYNHEDYFVCICYNAYCRVYLEVLHFRHPQISPKAFARFTTFTIYKRYKSCDPLKEFYPFFEFSLPLFHQILTPHLYILPHHEFTLLHFVLLHKSSNEILQIPDQLLRTTSTFGHLANKFPTFYWTYILLPVLRGSKDRSIRWTVRRQIPATGGSEVYSSNLHIREYFLVLITLNNFTESETLSTLHPVFELKDAYSKKNGIF